VVIKTKPWRVRIGGLVYPGNSNESWLLNGELETGPDNVRVAFVDVLITSQQLVSLAPAMLADWLRRNPAGARRAIRERLNAPAAAMAGAPLNRQRIEEAILRSLVLVLDDMEAQPEHYNTVAEELV
jgi:hypothetical protein